jgi:hypothetical protein
VIIQPRSYYETIQVFRVTSGFSLQMLNGKKLSEMTTIPEYSGMRLEYHLSTKDLQNSDALGIAKRNWKSLGELVLDSNGEYSVKSEVILNKL